MENKEEREMTQEELDKIVGGYMTMPEMARQQIHQQQPQHQMPGIPCPKCQNQIPVSIYQILYDRSVFCPVCGLRLFIDKKKSNNALKILGKIDNTTLSVDK